MRDPFKTDYPWHIKPSVDGQWYFTLVGRNNKVIVTSETYTSAANARRGIKSLCGRLGVTYTYQNIKVYYKVKSTEVTGWIPPPTFPANYFDPDQG